MFSKLFKRKGNKDPKLSQHPTDIDALIEKAVNHTEALQTMHIEIVGIGKADKYDVDFERDSIVWNFADGKIISASASLIGTWSGQTGTFLWGWDHPISPPANSSAAQQVKAYADTHGINLLQDRKLVCKIDGAWQLAALAVLIGDLQGVYQSPSGDGSFAFIGYNDIKISNNKGE